MIKKNSNKTVKFHDDSADKGLNNRVSQNVKRMGDYIWITPDLLEKFTSKNQMPRKDKVLSLNTVHYHEASNNMKQLPPMFSERLQTLEEKAARNLNTDADKVKDSYRILPDYHLNLRGYNHLNGGVHLNKKQA